MDRGAWWAAVHSVAERRTQLKRLSMHHALEKEMATCSCSLLENPRDRGAWWAAVYGVAESQTRLSKDCMTNYVEKEMATHSSILAWKIPWTEEPGGHP